MNRLRVKMQQNEGLIAGTTVEILAAVEDKLAQISSTTNVFLTIPSAERENPETNQRVLVSELVNIDHLLTTGI